MQGLVDGKALRLADADRGCAAPPGVSVPLGTRFRLAGIPRRKVPPVPLPAAVQDTARSFAGERSEADKFKGFMLATHFQRRGPAASGPRCACMGEGSAAGLCDMAHASAASAAGTLALPAAFVSRSHGS
jgi:hypothetical protein